MIETLVTAKGEITRGQLSSVWNYLQNLKDIILGCRANFDWLRVSRAHAIHFLDADVIYGALPSITAAAAVKEAVITPNEPPLFDLDLLSGPQTIRWCLENLKDFCLPLGAMIEVESAYRSVTGRVAKEASVLDRCFAEIEKRRSFSDIMRVVSGERLSDALRENLLGVACGADEIDLVDGLLKRRMDCDELLGDENDPKADGAYRLMLSALSEDRPERRKQRANLCDAMNSGTVVKVFNRAASGKRERLLPVLISTTKPLLSNVNILTRCLREGGWQTRPRLVSERLYLFVSQSILGYVGHRRYQSALDYLVELQHDCETLISFCERFMPAAAEAMPSFDMFVEMSEDSQIRFKDLTSRLVCRWERFLQPHVRARQQDRVAFINRLAVVERLFSHEMKGGLDSSRLDEVRSAARQLQTRLRESSEARGFWQTVQHFAAIEDPGAVDVVQVSLFRVSRGEVDGVPLSLTQPGKPFDPSVIAHLQELSHPHMFRLLVHAEPGFGGALLAIDSWRHETPATQRMVRLTWRHTQDFEVVWQRGLDLTELCGNALGVRGPAIRYRLARPDAVIEDTALETRALRAILEQVTDVTYLELQVGLCTFFADITELEGVELQAGMVFPAECWVSAFQSGHALLATLAELNEQHLKAKRWRRLFDVLAVYCGTSSP